ncbi:MAG: cupin domain-containing protein [Bradyrhizobium sp.]
MEAVMEKTKPVTFVFEDDGLVPNNPLPFIIYKRVIDVDTAHPERTIEDVFSSHRWGSMWRNGIFDYLHYHSTAHEVLGVARGQARVRFGGDGGKVLDLTAGDVAILPAGTGHQCLFATRDLSVVGAYPPGQTMEITRPTPDNHAKAIKTIPRVAVPRTDPVIGEDGPLVRLWRR